MKDNNVSNIKQNTKKDSRDNLSNCDYLQNEKNLLNCNLDNLNNKWNYENGFYLTSDITRIAKLINHYELYKKIVNLPGDVLEFGVFKGASLIRIATFRNLLENDFSRKIVGFDIFGKFPLVDDELDNSFIKEFENEAGDGIKIKELKKFIQTKNFQNIKLIKGDINETLSSFLEENPHLKISLLHLDVDVYKPTKHILENLYSRVVKGGVIIFDDYNAVHGVTTAIDEFFLDKPETIEKLNFGYLPSFIVKK